MKTRNTSLLLGVLLALAGPFASAQNSTPIQVSVQVYRLDPVIAETFNSSFKGTEKEPADDRFERIRKAVENWIREGQAELVADPAIAAPAGTWTDFDVVQELTYPSEYDPATIPEKLPAKLVPQSTETRKKVFDTNKTNALIPPFPSDFESRELGLQLKLRPRFEAGSRIVLDLQIGQSALKGFIDYGTPIAMEKPNALRKNAKPIELLENRLLMPVFLKQQKEFQISPSTDGVFLLYEKPAPAKTTDTAPAPRMADLGKEHAQSELPPLLFMVSGQKLKPGLKALASHDSGTAAAETRSWPLSEVARQTFIQTAKEPGLPAASELKEKLGKLGIVLRDLTIGPDWNIEATATPEMLARIDALLPVYDASPQILVSTKFIETSEPLEIEKSILSELEFQTFAREVNQQKGIDLLSAPSILMRPFQDGTIEVVREFIYPVSYDPPRIVPANKQNDGASFPLTPSTPREFKTRNTGVQLAVNSLMLEDKSILLSFRPEVTESLDQLNFGQPIYALHKGGLGNYRRVVLSDNRIETPVFRSRSLESRIRIPDGATVLVGGLVKHDIQEYQDKIPVLGDLPIIGKAARSRKKVKISRYLYIALTAKTMEAATVAGAK